VIGLPMTARQCAADRVGDGVHPGPSERELLLERLIETHDVFAGRKLPQMLSR